jgi:hypothetical protein
MLTSPSLRLDLPSDWDAIGPTWDPCLASLRGAGLSGDEAYALAMVAQELLENAVKYGDAGSPQPIRLALQVTPSEVTIEVENRVASDDAHLRRFDRAVQWLRGFQDPFEAFVERLKQVSAESYRGGQSGLGLARIAYEARCLVDFYVDETSTLAVSAVYQRPQAAEPA